MRKVAVVLLLLAGCTRPAVGPAPAEATPPRAERVAPASFSLMMMDVGTGLALLLRGEDFALLYDAGSNDDRKTGPDNRALAYLARTLGPSGPAGVCGTDVDRPEIPLAHVVLSHPHRDHLSLLPDVFRCHAVANVWESGTTAESDAYRAFDEAVRAEPGVVRRTAKPGDEIILGRLARARVLSARAGARDANDASVVLRVDLGRASLLFMGDAEAGPRAEPGRAPSRGSVEAELLGRSRALLDVDVLVVGHHGSSTSSRATFLDAVSPRIALVSSGPQPYGRVELPDAEVMDELARRRVDVRHTKVDDEACRASPRKVGRDADGAPGGCSAVTLHIESNGAIVVEDGPQDD